MPQDSIALHGSLEKTFADQKWFHSIDFGEFASSGRFKPGSPQNITLYGFMDLVRHIPLAGQTVLDIGVVLSTREASTMSSRGFRRRAARRL